MVLFNLYDDWLRTVSVGGLSLSPPITLPPRLSVAPLVALCHHSPPTLSHTTPNISLNPLTDSFTPFALPPSAGELVHGVHTHTLSLHSPLNLILYPPPFR